MSWSDNNNNPWGSQGGGNGRGQGPDMDNVIRDLQNKFKGFLPGSFFGKLGPVVIIVALVLIWLATGFYRVLPDEQGVVLQFGKYIKTTQPGLNYHIPYPVERVLTPKVTKVNRVEIGYRQSPDNRTTQIRDVPEESLMLTGDENIVDIDFSVFWIINDAGKFLFNVQVPELTIKSAAETSMREVIGQSKIQSIFTEGRTEIEDKTRVLIQSILDDYETGVTITQVQTQKADPPGEVIDSFRDVQAARADLERQRNEAEAYANDIIPRARGEAEQILQSAEGYKQKVIADSEGKAARFLSIQSEYAKAPVVTKQRIFYETMESVFGDMDKIIIDNDSGQGVLPYLPLPEISKKASN
ncbi:FtsH protease activity modulator HflK [bacterium]|jgi:membrane protease subunit HflK|nr:FtsH protease activity modulator HflK [Pelagibacteraceae bacterium]MDC3130713.1 FtsH protease activity modulator HflK [bacterium]